jgi:DNA-directed RNA polymerase subunit N (RpoN/RPB10)
MEALRKTCEGFTYAGWNVYAQKAEKDMILGMVPYCTVCRRTIDTSFILIQVSIRTEAWRIARVHEECLPWTDHIRNQWITRPFDPLTPHKGLVMICRAFALGGQIVCTRPSELPPRCICFICKNPISEKHTEFTTNLEITFAQAHEKCIGPFIEEKDRATHVCERARAWKIWAISFLGDCRFIIGEFLVRLPIYGDVFDTMYSDC